MKSEAAIRRCRIVAAPPDWPLIHVLAVTHPGELQQGPAQKRAAARKRVRRLLLQYAGPAIAAPFLFTPGSAAGAGRASFSHGQSFSILAWCEQGCVGVDLVELSGLASASPKDLALMATLYMGEKSAAREAWTMTTHSVRQRFADAWARQEARLKCLGLELEESYAALQVRLSDCSTARVALPPSFGADADAGAAWIAWRFQTPAP